MHYLIDGYNVTRRDPSTKDLPLENQRAELEKRLRIGKTMLPGKATYSIVWDAAGGAGIVHPTDRSEYTRMPTADDAIVEKVRRATERIGVVTSDYELAGRCRSGSSKARCRIPSGSGCSGSRQAAREAKGGREYERS